MRYLLFLFAVFCFCNLSAQVFCDTIALQTRTTSCGILVSVNTIPTFPPKKMLLLDFEKREVCDVTSGIVGDILSKGFKEIKSSFHSGRLRIYIDIKKKEYAFDFDCSFPGSFSMKFDDDLSILKEEHEIEDDGHRKHFYNNKWITLGGVNFSSVITIDESNKRSCVGMGFIQGFYWIVDAKNKKVYIKKNSIPIAGCETLNPYTAGIKNEKLLIVSHNIKYQKYKLGDEISSVNGISVTKENSSQMLSTLNSTKDWNSLEIGMKQN